ncbi:hypothetical protein ACTMSW_22345 [Micromonospora sp. BQ11]|uniref:hypothetical protein n=1 Tax=Micromonospora sp. BQ11 TaxID=3452212 RepID=UPI003F8A2590
MRGTRLGLFSSVIAATVVLAGCTDGGGSTGDPVASGAASTAATTPAASPSATATGAAGLDAATASACTAADGEIRTALKKVAEAEKIGPPAGHFAVSAEYSAGAATLYAQAFTTSPAVNDAVKQVGDAMSDLADRWTKAPSKAPSRTALTTAVKRLETACSPT